MSSVNTTFRKWVCGRCAWRFKRAQAHSPECPRCKFSNSLEVQTSRPLWRVFAMLSFVLVGSCLSWMLWRDEISALVDPRSSKGLTEEQAFQLLAICQADGDLICQSDTLTELIHIQPKEPEWKNLLAEVRLKRGNAEGARALLEELHRTGELEVEGAMILGELYEKRGEIEKAAQFFESAVERDPGRVDAVMSLARAQFDMGDQQGAAELLQSYIRSFPTYRELLEPIAQEMVEAPKTPREVLEIEEQSGAFLVDMRGPTGKPRPLRIALIPTETLLDSDTVRAEWPEAFEKARPTRVMTGQKVETFFATTVPQIMLGPWSFENVRVLFCDRCDRVAGHSLRDKIRVRTRREGRVRIMEMSID